MKKHPEARITLRHLRDCKVEIGVYSVHNNHEMRTGLTAGPFRRHIDEVVMELKKTLEKAYDHVWVKDMGPI